MNNNANINIYYDKKNICELDSGNPDFTKLVDFFVGKKEEDVNLELLSVECEKEDVNKKFDKETFISIIKHSVNKYYEYSKINLDLLEEWKEKI